MKRRGLALLLAGAAPGAWFNPDLLVEPFNDLITAIVEDDNGRLWLGAPKGVFWVLKSEILARGAGRGGATSLPPGRRGRGRELGPGSFGAQPTAEAARRTGPSGSRPAPACSWSSRRPARQHHRGPGGHDRGRDRGRQPDGARPEIVLPPGTRSLSVDYAAPSFISPRTWPSATGWSATTMTGVNADNRRTAYYTNIKPGHYRFEVTAANEDGLWVQNFTTLAFTQQPWFTRPGGSSAWR